MFEGLRARLDSPLDLGQETSNKHLEIRGTMTHHNRDIKEQPPMVDYKTVCRVILITEVSDIGMENPVALAFVKQDASAVILSLKELGEAE